MARKQLPAQTTDAATQEQPGQKRMGAPFGNQNAFKGKLWREAINRALQRRSKGEMVQALDQLADRYLWAIFNGKKDYVPGFESLGSRLDGKPVQALEHSGPEGEPLPSAVTVTLVRPPQLGGKGE